MQWLNFMIIIQETDKVFIVFFKKEIFLDTNTVSISTSLRGTELLWHQNLFFSMSISRNVNGLIFANSANKTAIIRTFNV